MSALVVTLVVLVALVVLVLSSWVHVDGRVDVGLARVRVRWTALSVAADLRVRAIEVAVFGLRVARRPFTDERRREDGDVDRDAARARRRHRRGMSWSQVRAGWRFYRRQLDFVLARVRVGHLVAHVRIASEDPAVTGIAYGVGCAIAAPLLRRWPTVRISLEPDFVAELPSGRGSVAARVRISTLALVGWRVFRYQRATDRGPSAAAPEKGQDHGSS